MLLYHCHSNDIDSNFGFKNMKNKNKSSKKGYKSTCIRKSSSHSINDVEERVLKKSKVQRKKKSKVQGKKKSKVPTRKPRVLRIKKSKVLRKKRVLKKNVQFLEGLGLKVKQQQ